jgi:hypothetical protein
MSNPNFNSVEFDGVRKQAANPRSVKLFYLAFPNLDAVRLNSSWTHCRTDFKDKVTA